jgi:rhomboid protease GluP
MPTQRFRVNFSAPSAQEEPPNNLHLEGAGTLVFEFDRVVLVPDLAPEPYAVQKPEFEFTEIANVTLIAPAHLVVIRTSDGLRYASVWAHSRLQAEQIRRLLPNITTQDFQHGWPSVEESARKVRSLDASAPVTATLVVANIVMYLVTLSVESGSSRDIWDEYIRLGSQYGPLVWHGEPWRLLTATFLHAGFGHLAGNMIALLVLGPMTERLYGSPRFTLIYLMAALAGNVLSGCVHPGGNSVGASGAIMGVLGAMGAFAARWPKELAFPDHARMAAAALSMAGQALIFGMQPGIDNAAHIGGLLAGFAVGWPLARGLDPWERATANPLLLARVAVVACGLLLVLIACAMPWR